MGKPPQVLADSSQDVLQLCQAVVVADGVCPFQVELVARCKIVVVGIAGWYVFRYALSHQTGRLIGPGSRDIVLRVTTACHSTKCDVQRLDIA